MFIHSIFALYLQSHQEDSVVHVCMVIVQVAQVLCDLMLQDSAVFRVDAFVRDHFVNMVFVVPHIRVDLPVVERLLCDTDSALCDFQGFAPVIANQIDEIVDLLGSVALCKLLFLAVRSNFLLFFQQKVEFDLSVSKDG